MEFTIVGAGALGTILAAHLIDRNHHVNLIARGQRANDIAIHGLRMHGLRALKLPGATITQTKQLKSAEILIFAVKTHQLANAIDSVSHLKPACTFSVANGVVKNRQLADAYGAHAVVGCMANFSGELENDGRVNFTRNVCLHLGSIKGYQGPAASDVAATINAAGIVTAAVDNIESVEWSKFVGWVALFSVSIIARTVTGEFLSNPQFAEIIVSIIKEAGALAKLRGIILIDQSPLPVDSIVSGSFDDAINQVRQVGNDMLVQAPDHRMSSLQDLLKHRSLEINETVGYLIDEANRAGLDTPVLKLCYQIGLGLDRATT